MLHCSISSAALYSSEITTKIYKREKKIYCVTGKYQRKKCLLDRQLSYITSARKGIYANFVGQLKETVSHFLWYYRKRFISLVSFDLVKFSYNRISTQFRSLDDRTSRERNRCGQFAESVKPLNSNDVNK